MGEYMLEKPGPKTQEFLQSLPTPALLAELGRRAGADPSLIPEFRNILKQIEVSQTNDLPSKWKMRIKEEGAALLHGKFHPDWFTTNKKPEEIQPLGKEPGFADAGHINSSPKPFAIARSPLAGKAEDVFRFATLMTAKRQIPKETHLVFLSPEQTPDSKFNQSMLDSRFKQPWREIVYAVNIKAHPFINSRTPDITQIFKIFLPSDAAQELFQDISLHPKLPEQIIRLMYPSMPFEPVERTMVFAKELSQI